MHANAAQCFSLLHTFYDDWLNPVRSDQIYIFEMPSKNVNLSDDIWNEMKCDGQPLQFDTFWYRKVLFQGIKLNAVVKSDG